MAGTWPTARAAIKTHMHGVAIVSPIAETLTTWEWPPPGAPGADAYPYAYIVPPERIIGRGIGGEVGQRQTDIPEVLIPVVLSPADLHQNRELLGQRCDAWMEALADAFDDALSLDTNADWIGTQTFSPLGPILYEGNRWGFEMRLEVHLSETKTFGA